MPNEFPVPPHVKVCPSESGSEPVISKEVPEHCLSALSFSHLTYESRLNVFPLILLSVKSSGPAQYSPEMPVSGSWSVNSMAIPLPYASFFLHSDMEHNSMKQVRTRKNFCINEMVISVIINAEKGN